MIVKTKLSGSAKGRVVSALQDIKWRLTRWFLSLFIIGLTLLPYDVHSQPATKCGDQVVALSLKTLQQRTQERLTAGQPLDDELRLLGGINWLMGYVVDKENKDVILFGRHDPSRPPLYLDDFVVAVRNAWQEFVPPGCTILPTKQKDVMRIKEVMNKLMDKLKRNQNDPSIIEDLSKEWREFKVTQTCSVLGVVPRNSRFAKTMVDADYDMKKVAYGQRRVEGIDSYLDLLIGALKAQVESTGATYIPPILIGSQFYFFPDTTPTIFVEDEGITALDTCKVTLIAKQISLSTGQIEQTGQEDPLAQQFCTSISERYSLLTKISDYYADLENLFRLVAVIGGMRFRDAVPEADVGWDYWLDTYPVSAESVPNELPFITEEKRETIRIEREDMYGEGVIWAPVGGGVLIDFRIKKKSFRRGRRGELSGIPSIVVNSRPNQNATSWPFSIFERFDVEQIVKDDQVVRTILKAKDRDEESYLQIDAVDLKSEGDATIVKSPNGSYILIDTGLSQRGYEEIKTYLPKGKISLKVVITHLHVDHAKGLANLLEDPEIDIKEIILGEYDPQTGFSKTLLEKIGATYQKIEIPNGGRFLSVYVPKGGVPEVELLSEQIETETFKVYTLHLDETLDLKILQFQNPENPNQASIITKITHKGKSYLFTGDIDLPVIKELLKQKEVLSRIFPFESDFLKWPHHGWFPRTKESLKILKEFLLAIDPHTVIFYNPLEIQEESYQEAVRFIREVFGENCCILRIKMNADGTVTIIALKDLPLQPADKVAEILFVLTWNRVLNSWN